jgi:hypothetical protein
MVAWSFFGQHVLLIFYLVIFVIFTSELMHG